ALGLVVGGIALGVILRSRVVVRVGRQPDVVLDLVDQLGVAQGRQTSLEGVNLTHTPHSSCKSGRVRAHSAAALISGNIPASVTSTGMGTRGSERASTSR